MAARKLLTLVAGVVLAVSWTTPALAQDAAPAGATVNKPLRAELSPESRENLSKLELRNVETGATIRPFAPGGIGVNALPCNAPTGFSGTASYTNGVLTSVQLSYYAQVSCPTGLVLGAIVVTAGIWKNTTLLDQAPSVNCTNCTVSPTSSDFYACGGVGCAGSYWSANVHSLFAPTGYVWTGAPAGCIGYPTTGPPYQFLQCSQVSTIAVVSPSG